MLFRSFSFGNLVDGNYVITDSLHSTYANLDFATGTGADSAAEIDVAHFIVKVQDGDDAVNYNKLNYRPSKITLKVYDDEDGNFTTLPLSTLKQWHVSLTRISQNPITVVQSGDTSAISDSTLGAGTYVITQSDSTDRKSTRLNSSHVSEFRMPSSA
mgnify:CR=1 FL=1